MPNAANVYAPGKRPFQTIIPGFVTKDGQPFMSFGLMGGDMQPQGHVQVLTDIIDFGMNIQEAGDAARWRHFGGAEPTGEPSTGVGTVEMEIGLRSGGESGTREARLQDWRRAPAASAAIRRSCGTPSTTSIGARPRCARTAKRSGTENAAGGFQRDTGRLSALAARRSDCWFWSLLLVAWRLFAPISTPPFTDASGKPLHDSMAVVERWPVNGTVQSVVIRSRDVHNPILIWLHGGPGSGETPVLRRFNGMLESRFTVVYWDQRYAGQSYDPFQPVPKDLTIAQYVRDLDVVVDRLRARFHRQKVFLVGQSWGTAIGTLYAQAHPEKVIAYVGIGQVVNTAENEALSYRFVLREARTRRDTAAIRMLEEIGPPPRKSGPLFTPRDLVAKYGGFAHSDLGLSKLIFLSLASPETNWRDVAALSVRNAIRRL